MTEQQKEKINNNIEEDENNKPIQEEEDYEEMGSQAIEEDGQEFEVAFDIQINNGSFILLVGTTDESKLIMRLVEKEDDTKPFYQNEFSLEELKQISPFFQNFNNENDAFECVIKNLNDCEKEIELVDDNCIKLSILINEEDGTANVDFVLHKIEYIIQGEGDEEQQIKEENMNVQNENGVEVEQEGIQDEMDNVGSEPGVEEIENEENYNEFQNEEENMDYSEDVEKSDNNKDDLSMNGNLPNPNIENISNDQNILNKKLIKKNINLTTNLPSVTEQINNQNQNGLQTILEDANENYIISSASKQSKTKENKDNVIIKSFNEQNESKEEKDINQENENDFRGSKISKVIEELKDNLDSLGGAMNYIGQEDQEQNDNGNLNEKINGNNDEINNNNKNENFSFFKDEIIRTINSLSYNFNNQLKKQNEYFIKIQKDIELENENKLKEIKNELNKKNNELNDIKKLLNEKISILEKNLKNEINKTHEEIKNIKNKDNDNNNNNFTNKRQERVNSKRDITQNNFEFEKIKNELNSKIREIEQKINNMKNEANNYNRNNRSNDSFNMNIKCCMEKINNIESKLKQNDENLKNNNNTINEKINNFELKLKSANDDKVKKNLLEKINNLENKSKNVDNIINNLKKNNLITSSSSDKIFYDKLNNLEKIVNEIKEKKNKSELNIKIIEEINNNDLINKVNNLINWSKTYENEFQNIETEIKNNDNYLDNIEKRITNLENKIKLNQSYEKKRNKVSNSSIHKISNNIINNEEQKNEIDNINNQNKFINIKKIKKTKITNSQYYNDNNIQYNNRQEKTYKIIRPINDIQHQPKKYMSQTYNTGNNTISNSMNRIDLQQINSAEKGDEYQIFTRSRSGSKGHKRKQKQNQDQENFSDSYSSKKDIYKNKYPNLYDNEIVSSKIIQYDDIIFLENRIKEIYPKLNFSFNLVYRATEDGDKSIDFHKKCDKIGPNITFVKTKNGYVFGGFTVKNWEHLKRDINVNKPNLGSASRDSKAFGFCINYQKIYNNERPNEFAIWCNRNFGPTFKNNFFQIYNNCFKRGGYCSVKKNSHFGGQEQDYEISGGEAKFGVEEIEVFELLFQ